MFGLFELVFLGVAWQAAPSSGKSLPNSPFAASQQSFLYLVAANIGAVIMPWMVFYQQSAVVDKGLTVRHLKVLRWDTAMGAVMTQMVMAAVLIASRQLSARRARGSAWSTCPRFPARSLLFWATLSGALFSP